RIFVTNEGQFVNGATLQWVARKEGLPYQFSSPGLWRDIALYRQAMKESDFVLAFRVEQPQSPHLPSEQLAAKTVALARTLDGLSEIRAFPCYNGTTYYLFARKPMNRQPASAVATAPWQME